MKRAIVLSVAALFACTSEPQKPAEKAVVPSAGTVRAASIVFPAQVNEAVASTLSPTAIAKIALAKLPVLALPTRLENLEFVVEPNFVTFSGAVDKTLASGAVSRATVTVSASRLVHDIPGMPEAQTTHAMRGARGNFTINEGIATTSWIEGGVAYSLDVECSQEADDRCANEAFAISLTNSLAFVGGRP